MWLRWGFKWLLISFHRKGQLSPSVSASGTVWLMMLANLFLDKHQYHPSPDISIQISFFFYDKLTHTVRVCMKNLKPNTLDACKALEHHQTSPPYQLKP